MGVKLSATRGAHRPLVGQHGSLAWWFDGELLRIAHVDRPVSTRNRYSSKRELSPATRSQLQPVCK